MRKRLLSLIMALCMVFSLAPAVSAEETPVTVTVAGQENETFAADVFTLVNEVRAENGIGALTRNATLSELAMQRAAEIALYMDHYRPDGTICFTVFDGVYSGYTNYGENIASGQSSPDAVMESWMNSEGHRDNILTADYTQIGIGCFYADGVYCWVQLFSNSTTNTAETSETGTSHVAVDVEILPSNLALTPSGTMDLELEVGASHALTIRSVNPAFDYVTPVLVVGPGSVTDAAGNTIATRTVTADGTITITAENPGSAAMDIPVYDGQPDALRVNITVPAEEIPTTAPTEPAPTEPAPTEPAPTEPAPTEPAPTEPAPTEPAPTEPAPTEPKPTEPASTEPQPTEPQPSEPDDGVIASGECGENAVWVLDSDGTLTISGTGSIGSAGKDYKDQIVRLVVEEGITGIGDYAFSHYEKLVAVTLPESVTTLGCCAFEHCYSLVTIDLPESMEGLDLGCFRECTSLVSVRIPTGLPYIGDEIFSNCTALQALSVPDTVTHIEGNALWGCPNLVIYCYELSYAHRFAIERDYPFQLMEDDPDTPTYSITITSRDGGIASITPNPSPANRYVLFEVTPDKGYVLDQVYYLRASDPELEVEFLQIGENQYMFMMPKSDVILDVYFLATESPFRDVKASDYFYDPVLWAVSYDITSGVGNGRFAPGDPCTRAQVVTFLWRAAGEPEPVSRKNPFTDVKSSDYYYKAVLWAVENGITTGMSANTFAPNSPCTRGQVVTFLWRAAGEPQPYHVSNPFTDVKSSAFYHKAVLWAVNYGITTGMTDTTFAPNSTCTRGQVVTFLYRFLR